MDILAYVLATFSLITFYFLMRHFRIKKIEKDLAIAYLEKSSRALSLNKNLLKRQKDNPEILADALQSVGVACYNYISLSESQEALANSNQALDSIPDELKETIVFKALSRRHPDHDSSEIIDKFQHHLSNKTLLKGDVGEEIGATLREQQGYSVEFPMSSDGTWKSNQEGYDYTVEKDGVSFKENPKVGYDDNFDKIKDQALENPDVNYITGTQHADDIRESGLTNIQVSEELNTENIMYHVQEFENASGLVQETASSLPVEEIADNFMSSTIPVLTLAFVATRQYKLYKSGDVNLGEASMDLVTKTGAKWGGTSGGGFAGAQIGLLIGGPVGFIVGGAIGSFGGSILGGKFHTAWKSEALFKLYNEHLKTLDNICQIAIEDIKIKDDHSFKLMVSIRSWFWKNPLKVIWPDKTYVINKQTIKFLESHQEEMAFTKINIESNKPKLASLKVTFGKVGFFGRLLGDFKEETLDMKNTSLGIIKAVSQADIIRTTTMRKYISKWEEETGTIEKQKRKLAA